MVLSAAAAQQQLVIISNNWNLGLGNFILKNVSTVLIDIPHFFHLYILTFVTGKKIGITGFIRNLERNYTNFQKL
jgi:hypothetical protein